MFGMISGVLTFLGFVSAISEGKEFFDKLFSSGDSVRSPNEAGVTVDISKLFVSRKKEHERQKELMELEQNYEKDMKKMEYEFNEKIKKIETEHRKDELNLQRYKEEMLYKYRNKFLDTLMTHLQSKEDFVRGDLKRLEEAKSAIESLQGNLLPPPSTLENPPYLSDNT